jgi:hypothetical protein
MEVAVVSLLGAFGLFACARQDQASVQAPLAEIGSVKVAEPAEPASPSPYAEAAPPNRQEEGAKGLVLDQFERWAGANIRFAFSSRPHRSDACFDNSDVEVSCASPTAVRQETKTWDEIAGTVVNRSEATLTCETTGSTKETAALHPKGTHTFAIFTKPRVVDAEREVVSVRCTMMEDAVKVSALPERFAGNSGPVGVETQYGNSTEAMTSLLIIGKDRGETASERRTR